MSKESTKKILFFCIGIVIGICIALIPPPEGLTTESMRFMGIFLGAIFMLVTKPIADWSVILGALALFPLTKTATVNEAFSAFSGGTMWLISMVFAFSAGMGKSGLINRIAMTVLSIFPATYRGAVTALTMCGVVVGPLIPSVTAKVNMIIPIATASAEKMGLKERSKSALGLWSAVYTTVNCGGNVFLSGSLHVSVMMGFMTKESFTYGSWFLATIVWFLVILVGNYLYCIFYCKPDEDLNLPPTFFKEKAKELGPASTHEKIATILLITCLIVWTTTKMHGLDTAMFGLLAIVVMVASGLITTEDFVTKIPWGLMVFIGGLLGMSTLMNTLGWSNYIAAVLGPVVGPVVSSPWIFVPFLCIFSWVLRFVVIDNVTSLVIMNAVFSPFMEAAHMSSFVLIFVHFMAALSWNMEYQNVYTRGTLAVAGNKYVTYKEAQKTSFVFCLLHLIATFVSIPIWQALGLIW